MRAARVTAFKAQLALRTPTRAGGCAFTSPLAASLGARAFRAGPAGTPLPSNRWAAWPTSCGAASSCAGHQCRRGLSSAAAKDDFYGLLGIDKSASKKDIKKAYRKRAMETHPDKDGGDETKFQAVARAYEVLGDDTKKQIYDQYGAQGVDQAEQGGGPGGGGGGGGGDPFDIFNSMFGGGFGGGGQQQQQQRQRQHARSGGNPNRPDDIVLRLKLSLADIYVGKTIEANIKKSASCKACEGKGGEPGFEITCTTCSGSGQTVQQARTMFGMQQVVMACDSCGGVGIQIDPIKACGSCRGQKLVERDTRIRAKVPAGAMDNEIILVQGEGDEMPDGPVGDVVFVVSTNPHEKFVRRGPDLFFAQQITLGEALCGTEFMIDHLDGSRVRVKLDSKEIVEPDGFRKITGLGMPTKQPMPDHKGDLFVHFKIQFPVAEEIGDEEREMLEKALPRPPKPLVAEDEAHTAKAMSEREIKNKQRKWNATEQSGGGQRRQGFSFF